MPSLIFQHLTSELGEGPLRNIIYLFGRQENGQSVCVQVHRYKPHVTIKTSEKPEIFELKIRKEFRELLKSDKIKSQKEGKYRRENVTKMKHINVLDDLEFDWYEGQDICDYNEEGPIQFVTIRTCPKKIYKSKSSLFNVLHSSNNGIIS